MGVVKQFPYVKKVHPKGFNFKRPVTPKPDWLLTHNIMIAQIERLHKSYPTLCRSVLYVPQKIRNHLALQTKHTVVPRIT